MYKLLRRGFLKFIFGISNRCYLAKTGHLQAIRDFNHNFKFYIQALKTGPEVIKLFSCSTQLSMKFSPLINVKMPTIVGILTCMSGKNNILGLTEP